MKRVSLFFIFVAIFGIFFIVSQAQAYVFSRNLKLGDQGLDVLELQKVLNTSSDTQISSFGIGSPGQESTYFGLLTHQAVIRYQNKYKNEVLLPFGLTSGTGFVGAATRNYLNSNSLAQNIVINPLPAPVIPSNKVIDAEKIDIYATDKKTLLFQEEIAERINTAITDHVDPNIDQVLKSYNTAFPKVFIASASNNLVKPGTRILLSGVGLKGPNTIYFGPDYVVRGVSGLDAGVYVTVPSIPAGKYDVVVKNSGGISNSKAVIVASYTISPVTITSASPQTVKFGDTVTVKGTGFTKSNDIITKVGAIKGISSKGTSLSFTFEPEIFKEVVKVNKYPQTIPIDFYIINESGFSQAFRFNFSY